MSIDEEAPLSELVTDEELREAIRLERIRELGGEGHSWQDINHFILYSETVGVDQFNNLFSELFPGVDEFRKLWPIPASALASEGGAGGNIYLSLYT